MKDQSRTMWMAPPMLLALSHRPTVGGLAVPWVTIRTPNGYLFGSIDGERHDMAIHVRLCQTCGKRLQRLVVFAMRPGDLARMLSPEAGMHPWCAWYTARACPMIAGVMSHYRASPPKLPDNWTVQIFGDPSGSRPKANADKFLLVYTTNYRPVTDPVTHRWAAMVIPDWIVRILPTGSTA